MGSIWVALSDIFTMVYVNFPSDDIPHTLTNELLFPVPIMATILVAEYPVGTCISTEPRTASCGFIPRCSPTILINLISLLILLYSNIEWLFKRIYIMGGKNANVGEIILNTNRGTGWSTITFLSGKYLFGCTLRFNNTNDITVADVTEGYNITANRIDSNHIKVSVSGNLSSYSNQLVLFAD